VLTGPTREDVIFVRCAQMQRVPRTNWTRRVPHPVLIGHAASLSQMQRVRLIVTTQHVILDEAFFGPARAPARRAPRAASGAARPAPGGRGPEVAGSAR
jgi:hypothetical protein